MDIWEFAGKYVAPLALGGVGTLAANYLGWGIEKRRQKLAYRKDLVQQWRTELVPLLNDTVVTGGTVAKYPFMKHAAYASLRPHLKPELVKQLEGKTIHIVVGSDAFPRRNILDEIGRIEREWNLV
jgi:hypothetical protein